ncbi:hypothetical protein [Corynebacterium dentalis]|uniref:hypothetical protein n=1 Tax=Corynebacterium dentalis TaxID=2014528 RepID=UPI00370D254C
MHEGQTTQTSGYASDTSKQGRVHGKWGGWPRTLFILIVVLAFSSTPALTIDDPSPAVPIGIGALTLVAIIAILFNPVNPDRSLIVALGAYTAASAVAMLAGGSLLLSLLFVYIVYETSAYASRGLRPWLAGWIFLGAAVTILADSSLIDTFSQDDPLFLGLTVAEVKTVMSYVFGIILVWIVTSIPWLIGKFMRGKRRAQSAD